MKELLTNVNRNISNNRKIEFIVIHYVGAISSAKANATYFENIMRGASAHYFVDENEIYRVVKEKDIAWSVGTNGEVYNGCYNDNSINVELCCKNNGIWYFEDETLNNAVDLVKELLTRYPDAKLCRHYDVTHKVCPEPFVRDINAWNGFVTRCTEKSINKSINEIARKVIKGEYGNGTTRKYNIEKAGYNYREVQNEVNRLCGIKISSKSINEIAKEVLSGKWGNGIDRKKRLADEGYNYKEIQAQVNRLCR